METTQEEELIPSYGSPVNLEKKDADRVMNEEFVIQEKYDGSQMSFSLVNGEVVFRSRSSLIDPNNGQFKKAMAHILERKDRLQPGLVFRGEAITKKKHNVLCYDREPDGNFVLFDIQDLKPGGDSYFDAIGVWAEELEVEPAFCFGKFQASSVTPSQLDELIKSTPSTLGGSMEGVVLKSYTLFDRNNKPLKAKYVSPLFRELHTGKRARPKAEPHEIIKVVAQGICCEARFQKAYQHLSDEGILNHDMTDMGKLLKELHQDLLREGVGPAKDMLWNHFQKAILKTAKAPMKDWWMKKLEALK